MAISELELLKRCLKLVGEYTKAPQEERDRLRTKGYLGKPLFYYIPVLITYAPGYRPYFTKFFNLPSVNSKEQMKLQIKMYLKKSLQPSEEGFIDPIAAFFKACIANPAQFNELRNLTQSPNLFSQSRLEELERLQSLPYTTQQEDILTRFLQDIIPEGSEKPSEIKEPAILSPKEINAELAKNKKLDIRYVEKSHPKTSSPEDLKKLDQLLNQPQIAVTPLLVDTQGKPLTTFIPPKFQTPSIVKDIGVWGKIKFSQLLNRFGKNLITGALFGTIGGFLGGATGAVVGAIGGATIVPRFFQAGGGAVLEKTASALANIGAKQEVATNYTYAEKSSKGSRKIGGGIGGKSFGKMLSNPAFLVIGVFALIVVLFLFDNILQTSTPFPPAGVTYSANVPGVVGGGGSGGSGDISACKFIRSDHTPRDAQYQSPLLLSYFQEASNLTGIPPALLAAFMRVESPGLTSYTDEQVLNYRCIKGVTISPTGALGVMQIQPPGSKSLNGDDASCEDCIDMGARLIGKTVSTMTEDDYCNVRKSIIVGSGFILKKMSYAGYTYGNGQRWDPAWSQDKAATNALVTGYYGCLPYGGPGCTGKYNYGDDVWESLQNCQPATSAPPASQIASSCPIPDGVTTCGSIDTPRGGCSHCGVGYGADNTAAYCPSPWGNAKYTGNQFALDVGGKNGQDFYLPMVDGRVIQWTNAGEENGYIGAIQKYIGKDANGNSYLLYFHHTQNGSGNTKGGISGDFAGKICLYCNINNVHVHIQIKDKDSNWLDAAQYFCK